MPKIDLQTAPVTKTCSYPAPYHEVCRGREKIALGDLGANGGLDQFGVNLTRLKPGAASAHRHWHAHEDELVYILEGTATLIEDDGEAELHPGDVATFKSGVACGHMLVNRSTDDVVFLEVGTRAQSEECTYTDPDVDMHLSRRDGGDWVLAHKDRTPYEKP